MKLVATVFSVILHCIIYFLLMLIITVVLELAPVLTELLRNYLFIIIDIPLLFTVFLSMVGAVTINSTVIKKIFNHETALNALKATGTILLIVYIITTVFNLFSANWIPMVANLIRIVCSLLYSATAQKDWLE